MLKKYLYSLYFDISHYLHIVLFPLIWAFLVWFVLELKFYYNSNLLYRYIISSNKLLKRIYLFQLWHIGLIKYNWNILKKKFFLKKKKFIKVNFFFFKKNFFFTQRKNEFFVVTSSPWPFIFAWNLFFFVLIGFFFFTFKIENLNFIFYIKFLFFFILIAFLFTFYFWFRDLFREFIFFKKYSYKINKNTKLAFVLLILTEILLFFSFFWAFFHFSLDTSVLIGAIWPPVGIHLNSLLVAFINTFVLIMSSVSLTAVQKAIRSNNLNLAKINFIFFYIFSFIFLYLQFTEYSLAYHQINDSVFGSTMFFITFFHAVHVMLGVLFVSFSAIRYFLNHFFGKLYESTPLTLAIWYWHFVDVVWVFVFFSIYLWTAKSIVEPNSVIFKYFLKN